MIRFLFRILDRPCALAALIWLSQASTPQISLTLAAPIAGQFSGVVWGTATNNASLPGDFPVGTPVTGQFRFANTGQAPFFTSAETNSNRYVSLELGSYLRITTGGLVWETAGVEVIVRNDSPLLDDDLFSIAYDSSLGFGDPALKLTRLSFPGVPPSLPNSGFNLAIFDSASPFNLLNGDAIPSSPSEINVSAVTSSNGAIFGNVDGANSFYQINFLIDEISFRAVPEPSTAPLIALGAGLASLYGAWLKRQRQIKRAGQSGRLDPNSSTSRHSMRLT